MLDTIDSSRPPTPMPPCPRCGNPQTLELQVTLAVAGVRWFDCRACKRVFSKLAATGTAELGRRVD
jgi:hypothetical protein